MFSAEKMEEEKVEVEAGQSVDMAPVVDDDTQETGVEAATMTADDEAKTTEQAVAKLSQVRRYKDVLFNDLLGDYDSDGEYIVDENIMQDLIDMPKKIDIVDTEGIHARGFWGDKTFSFLVTPPVERKNGQAFCYLQLNEQIARMAGYRFDTVTATIATYEYDFDEFFDQRVREVFHLAEYEGDDTGEEGRQYRAEYIARRYELFCAMRACSEDYYERLEEIYFNHRLQVLNMDPELTFIMAEFSKKRTQLEAYLIISGRRYYFLNQLLDEVLLLHSARLSQSQMAEKMADLDQKFVQKSQEIKQKTQENPQVAALLPKQEERMTIVDENVAPKKPAPAPQKGVTRGGGDKPKPKKKGGKGGGKKGGDKKDKKNDKKNPLLAIGEQPAPPTFVSMTEIVKEVPEQPKEDHAEMFGSTQM